MNHLETTGATEESSDQNGHRQAIVSDVIELLPSAASATPEAMVRTVLCVDPEMDIPELMRVFVEQGISGAPVVSREGEPLGVVSKTDILRELCENPDSARTSPFEDDDPDGESDPSYRSSSTPGGAFDTS